MTDERDTENEALKEMFQSPGWKVLMRNTTTRIDNFRKSFPFNVTDERTLYFSRGVMATLLELASLERVMEEYEKAPEMPPEDD